MGSEGDGGGVIYAIAVVGSFYGQRVGHLCFLGKRGKYPT